MILGLRLVLIILEAFASLRASWELSRNDWSVKEMAVTEDLGLRKY
jgi:hypothetical protein